MSDTTDSTAKLRATATLKGDDAEYFRRVREREGVESDADALRECVQQAQAADTLRRERERLQEQLQAANKRIDASNELVEHVSEQRTLAEKKARAGIIRRVKWWLTGMDTTRETVNQ